MSELLIVEDDEEIGALLQSTLRAHGHRVSWQRSGASALAHSKIHPPDLVLLDLGLPDMDGVDACRRLRDELPRTVIVMVTARTDEMDVVVGLDAGADDYLTKPFGRTEILARVRAHLRRTGAMPAEHRDEPLIDGDLVVDTASRRCLLQDVPIPLKPREFDLLARLAASPGQALRRETLMHDVWDEHWFGSTKTLDVHVAAIRRKLAEAATLATPPVLVPTLATLRGYGYRFESTGDGNTSTPPTVDVRAP